MATPSIRVRRLKPKDAVLFRDIRLEALKDNPEAFSSTYEAESAKPLSWFKERLSGGRTELLGAFHGRDLVGIAGFAIYQGPKTLHKGRLWSMYVQPASRNAGVGKQLVEAIIKLARQRVEMIQLNVISENSKARRLYSSLGFVEYGVEKNALKYDGKYYDEVHMSKILLKDFK